MGDEIGHKHQVSVIRASVINTPSAPSQFAVIPRGSIVSEQARYTKHTKPTKRLVRLDVCLRERARLCSRVYT